jgi:hypothetical protein
MTPEIAFNDRLLTRLEYRRDWSTATEAQPEQNETTCTPSETKSA